MISLSKKGGRYIGEPMWCIIMLFLHRIDVLWNEQGGRWAFLCPIIEIDFLLLRYVAALCFVLCHIHHKITKNPQPKPNNLIVRYFFSVMTIHFSHFSKALIKCIFRKRWRAIIHTKVSKPSIPQKSSKAKKSSLCTKKDFCSAAYVLFFRYLYTVVKNQPKCLICQK